MKNMRGAFWALALAGAAYLWRNRGKVQQQLNSLPRQNSQNRLPDGGAPDTQRRNESFADRSSPLGPTNS